jgi:hypothetical protein
VSIVGANQHSFLNQESPCERLPTKTLCCDMLGFEDRTEETDNLRIDRERMKKVLVIGIGKCDLQPITSIGRAGAATSESVNIGGLKYRLVNLGFWISARILHAVLRGFLVPWPRDRRSKRGSRGLTGQRNLRVPILQET